MGMGNPATDETVTSRTWRFFPLAAALLAVACLVGWGAAHRVHFAPVDRQDGKVRALETVPEPGLVKVGVFTCYAYCSCPKCCGQWSGGPTDSGTMPTVGRTVAADWSVLPAGSVLYIDGLGRRAVEDTGSGIKGDKLDIFMEDHQTALEWGVRELEVWVYDVPFRAFP